VFGVGLLVFGTPTLLLLGYPFDQVLAYLLPCSILISALQVRASGGVRLDPLRRRFLLLTAPTVLAGTLTVLLILGKVNVRPLVGAMLIVTAFLRLGGARERLYTLVCRRLDPLLVGLGVLLGLTNLGGGVLMVVVSSLYEDKHRVRAQIAFCYGLVGLIQVATLAATTSVDWSPLHAGRRGLGRAAERRGRWTGARAAGEHGRAPGEAERESAHAGRRGLGASEERSARSARAPDGPPDMFDPPSGSQ